MPDSFHQPFVYVFIYFIVSGKFVSCQLALGTNDEAKREEKYGFS